MREYGGAARSVTWELTLRCNARCKHCASGAGRPRPDELSTREALAICHQLPDVGTECVCLFGGEALLHQDLLLIIAELRSLGIDVSLATNGIALDERRADVLLGSGVTGVSISLDGASPEVHDELRGRRGAWEKAHRAIQLCAERPFDELTVITSVSRANLSELDALADLLALVPGKPMWMINLATSHDPKRFPREDLLDREGYVELARSVDRLAQEYAQYLEITGSHDLGYFSGELFHLHEFQWQGCRAGIDTLGIRSDGKLKGCLILEDRHIEGDLRTDRLIEVWRDPNRFPVNRAFSSELLEGECADCLFGDACMGGCSEVAESYTGTPYAYPFCLYREERDAVRER